MLGKKVQLNKLSFHLAGDNIQNNVHLDLSLHSDAEEGDEVHHEDRPENRDVEELEEGTHKGNRRGFSCGVPELKLRQPSDERPELFIL